MFTPRRQQIVEETKMFHAIPTARVIALSATLARSLDVPGSVLRQLLAVASASPSASAGAVSGAGATAVGGGFVQWFFSLARAGLEFKELQSWYEAESVKPRLAASELSLQLENLSADYAAVFDEAEKIASAMLHAAAVCDTSLAASGVKTGGVCEGAKAPSQNFNQVLRDLSGAVENQKKRLKNLNEQLSEKKMQLKIQDETRAALETEYNDLKQRERQARRVVEGYKKNLGGDAGALKAEIAQANTDMKRIFEPDALDARNRLAVLQAMKERLASGKRSEAAWKNEGLRENLESLALALEERDRLQQTVMRIGAEQKQLHSQRLKNDSDFNREMNVLDEKSRVFDNDRAAALAAIGEERENLERIKQERIRRDDELFKEREKLEALSASLESYRETLLSLEMLERTFSSQIDLVQKEVEGVDAGLNRKLTDFHEKTIAYRASLLTAIETVSQQAIDQLEAVTSHRFER